MKRRLWYIFIVCMVLLLSAAAGETNQNAVPQNEYIPTVYRLFAQYGQYDQWPDEAKTQWLAALRTAADSDTAATVDALLTSFGANGDAAPIDTFLGNRYGQGRTQSISVFYVLQEAWGDHFYWTLEQRAQAWNWTYEYFTNEQWDVRMASLPGVDVVSAEEAAAIAWAAVSAAENLPEDITQTDYISSICYGVGRNYAADYPPYYTVVFGIPLAKPDHQRAAVTSYYSCSVSNLGAVMDSSYYRATPSPAETADTAEPTDFAQLAYSDTFSGWSLARKADFSQEWQAYMQDYLAAHPDYRGVPYYETLYTYGIPDETSISQAEAEALARRAAAATGATDDYLARAGAHFFFDVSDAAHPLWKVYFSTLFSHNTAYQDSLGVFVILSADTGNVVDAYTRESGKPLEAFR